MGKTSIIEALISRSFDGGGPDYEVSLAGNPSANGQWSEVSLPAELNKYDGIEIDLQIIDTRSEEAVREHLPHADAVILVYDLQTCITALLHELDLTQLITEICLTPIMQLTHLVSIGY